MGKGFLFILTLTMIIHTSPPAAAGERYEFFNGVRSLGMGGASVAVVNDETALVANPAALAKLRDYYFTIIDPEMSVSQEAEEIVGLDVFRTTDPQIALDKCNANIDRHLQTRAQVFPSVVFPYFGFGLFDKYEINAEVQSDDNKFHYHYNNDYAGVIGFGVPIAGGIIKFGGSVRAINRTEVNRDDLDPTSTTLTLKSLASSGTGFGADAGLIITAPTAWLPTLAATYRDIGRTSYNYTKGMFITSTDRPESTPESVDVGLSIFPIMGKGIRSTWTIEYQDVLTASDETDHFRRAHGGFELNYRDALFFRGGWNQHYYTAGLELAIANYQFQAATYGEDIGDSTTHREDRRYVVKFAFRF